MSGIPEPWGTLLALITGPLGAIVLLCVAIYFLWRLFREADKRADEALTTVTELTSAVKAVTTESRTWRRAMTELMRQRGIVWPEVIGDVEDDR